MASNSKTRKRQKIEPAAPAAPVSEVDDFSKTINESKARIHADQNKPLNRGRGRPPTVKPTGDNSSPISSKDAPPLASTQQPIQGQPNLAPMLVTPLQTLSLIPAKKYKCDELVLTSEEAQACAAAVNDLINAFIPDMTAMSPKTAAVFGAVMVFGAVTTNKVIILANYREKHKAEIEKQEKEINAQPKTEPQGMGEKIQAQDAFRKGAGIFPHATV